MSRITLLILKQAWPHLQLGPALHLLAFSTFQIDELTHFQKYYFFILRKSTVSLTFCDRILAPHSSSSSSSSFFVGGGGGEGNLYVFEMSWLCGAISAECGDMSVFCRPYSIRPSHRPSRLRTLRMHAPAGITKKIVWGKEKCPPSCIYRYAILHTPI